MSLLSLQIEFHFPGIWKSISCCTVCYSGWEYPYSPNQPSGTFIGKYGFTANLLDYSSSHSQVLYADRFFILCELIEGKLFHTKCTIIKRTKRKKKRNVPCRIVLEQAQFRNWTFSIGSKGFFFVFLSILPQGLMWILDRITQ